LTGGSSRPFEGGNMNRDHHRLRVRGQDMMVLDTNLFPQDSGESRLRISEKVAGCDAVNLGRAGNPNRDY